MRGKKVAVNTIFGIGNEVVSVICGFILPRLILASFGSQYNGLVNSITQFLSCAVLLRAGLGGATRAALYKPLAEHNHKEVCAIVNATDRYMKKIAVILAGLIIILAGLYPILVKSEFEWFFTFTLVLVIGASTFAESFFGITYLIILQADQRLWITSAMSIICYVLNTSIAAALIFMDASIHLVKMGSALVYVLYPISMGIYVRKKYRIDKKIPPDNKAISQRWDAFWHQVAVFVMNNTSIIVLTIFTNLLEVSVYSVYNMVMNGLKRVIMSFSNSQEAAYGNMIAKKQYGILHTNVSVMEIVMYGVSTIIYSCAAILILDFVRLYTHGITDVNYIRPVFAYIIILAGFFNGIRLPYQTVVQAAGHYKQTKTGAILEPIINISFSILFVIKYGMIGVAIGTLVATVFRTVQYSFYMCKHIIKRRWTIIGFRCFVSLVEGIVIVILLNAMPIPMPQTYFQWVGKALITGLISCVVVILGSFIAFPKDTINVIQKLKNVFFTPKK